MRRLNLQAASRGDQERAKLNVIEELWYENVASEPFVNQMRRGNVHVKASCKTFKNIYARFHTFHRMGASQERAAFFNKLRC
jgi:hypothetical protein